ncbi:GTP-binding protein [Promethearchaeum syntrophicum]|uniref:GTP-binding protein n=1 Tax=Promethearchaeum syntrophicum TaxID=2594042 RepID=A0A5B9D6T4_9ARCH|nr:GTP-binding protein [Candidatus Prometheoarchaeum syntrophicum]QEE14824.1 Ras family protein [Candidatus Prometheoarchaeum syntrophicum]
MAEDYDFLFKSVVVGDGGSGKTAVVVRFSQGFFQENYKLTIGVEFAVKTININNYNVKLQIWDTGGQERFRYVRPLYYKGSMGCIILFDLTNRESFDHVPKWLEEVKKESGNIPILLVGNKSDLIDERTVSLEEALQISKDLNMFYVESSAKNGNGVGDVFAILSLLMIGEDIPPEMLNINIPGGSGIKQNLNMPKSQKKIQEEKSISPLKPSPISTTVVKPSPISKPNINLGFNSEVSKNQKEPEWFAPAVSPKPKPEPKSYIQPDLKPEPKPYIPPERKPEPKPYIPPERKPEPKPFIPPEPKQESKPFTSTSPVEKLKKSENQDLFSAKKLKESSPKSEKGNFFAPSVPKKPSINQAQKMGSSISKNPFLTQNLEPILPKKSSNISYNANVINANKPKEKEDSSLLFNTLKETLKESGENKLKKHPKNEFLKETGGLFSNNEPKNKSSWGFMANVNKPSSLELQNKSNLSFKPSDEKSIPKHKEIQDKMKVKCPRCGSLVNKHFKFCNKCGNRI